MFSLDHRTFLEQDFAIVDPLLVDASYWQHLPAQPLGRREFDCDIAQLPHLLCLREVDEGVRIALLDVCDEFTANEDTAFFCALLRTTEPTSTLTRRLSNRLMLAGRTPRQTYYFRYFDPRVFGHLLRIMSPKQMQQLLAPALAWTWFDTLGNQWCEHRVAAHDADVRRASPMALELVDQQLDSIARIELVNRAMRRWQIEHPNESLASSQLPAIDAHAARAIEAEQLNDEDDQAQFVLDALEHGAQVHQAPAVRHILDSARNKQLSYTAGMRALGRQGLLAALRSTQSDKSP